MSYGNMNKATGATGGGGVEGDACGLLGDGAGGDGGAGGAGGDGGDCCLTGRDWQCDLPSHLALSETTRLSPSCRPGSVWCLVI